MTELCARESCTGCAACANRCPRGAIDMIPDSEGFAVPRINSAVCVECGLCVRACPQLNPSRLNPPMGKSVYAAWATDDAIRLTSSSGGLYSLLAAEVIRQGGLANGVAFDRDFNLTHRLVDCIEGLAALRGSKYVQSDVGRIYCEVENALGAGRPVLFISTPCQVAGLQAFLGRDYPQLVTCDIVCHGVPSPTRFKAMVAEAVRDNGVANPVDFRFRDYERWDYHPVVVDSEGKTFGSVMASDYLKSFLSGVSCRQCCHSCRFATFSRVADLTIGDFWGLGSWTPFTRADKKKGVSLLLVNSPRGWKLLNALPKGSVCLVSRDVRECEDNGQLYRPRRAGSAERRRMFSYRAIRSLLMRCVSRAAALTIGRVCR